MTMIASLPVYDCPSAFNGQTLVFWRMKQICGDYVIVWYGQKDAKAIISSPL